GCTICWRGVFATDKTPPPHLAMCLYREAWFRGPWRRLTPGSVNRRLRVRFFAVRRKPVSHAVNGLDIRWLLRLNLDLFADPAHINVDASGRNRTVVTPYAIEELIPRKHHTWVQCHVMKELELQGAQLYRA